MALPLFFHDAPLQTGAEIWLEEDTARHVVQVLRMTAGGRVRLTDGKGHHAPVVITLAEKKKCKVLVAEVTPVPPPMPALHIGIAFTKNASRNEWLLEKGTELGVQSFLPLMAKRTERERIRYDRWNNILVSALLQSQQYHLPVLREAATLPDVCSAYKAVPQKLIAHCIEDKERRPVSEMLKPGVETILLIGPEGDFTEEEVTLCEAQGYRSVSLGSQRLRTETAAMAACAYFNMINNG